MSRPARITGLRAIALFEALKGAIAVLAWLALLDLRHHDVHEWVDGWIQRLALDPHEHLSELMLHYADQLPTLDVHRLGALALAYSVVRGLEAWGLWRGRVWAQYLGAGSGAIYIPFELHEWWSHPSALTTGVIALNVGIVAYLVGHLWRERHRTDSPDRMPP